MRNVDVTKDELLYTNIRPSTEIQQEAGARQKQQGRGEKKRCVCYASVYTTSAENQQPYYTKYAAIQLPALYILQLGQILHSGVDISLVCC